MKKILPAVLLFLMMACQTSDTEYQASSTTESLPDYAALQKELEEIYDIDQTIRDINWDSLNQSGPEVSIAYSRKMIKSDSLNQLKVIPILEQYGWLPKSKIGEKASRGIYYVVQHSNLSTIEKYLPQMELLAKQGEASPTDAATMRDRLLMFQGKKQVYGTQASSWARESGEIVIWPIEDVENVNRRREEVGFNTTVEENAKRLDAIYNPLEELPEKNINTQN